MATPNEIPFRIGNQTAVSAGKPSLPFEFALAHGFHSFEWFPDKKDDGSGWAETDLDRETRKWIQATATDHDLRLSVHAPLGFSTFEQDGLDRLDGAVQYAIDIGAALLNLHLDSRFGPEAFAKSLAPLIRKTAEKGLSLAVENGPEHAPEDFNDFFGCLKAGSFTLPTEHVGMCFDLGHANLCESTRNDYLGYLGRLSPQVPIIHLHLHENYGDADRHLPLFTGPAGTDNTGIRELLAHLNQRGFHGSAILEQWPDPPSLLTRTRDQLQALLPEGLKKKAARHLAAL